MRKPVLTEVFELLKSANMVGGEGEFCRKWLGRSECYLRTLRFKATSPSVSALAICASRLQHYGNVMLEGDDQEIGRKFLALSRACHEQVNSECDANLQIG